MQLQSVSVTRYYQLKREMSGYMLLSEDGAIKTCVRAASFIELCDKGKLDWGQSQNF